MPSRIRGDRFMCHQVGTTRYVVPTHVTCKPVTSKKKTNLMEQLMVKTTSLALRNVKKTARTTCNSRPLAHHNILKTIFPPVNENVSCFFLSLDLN